MASWLCSVRPWRTKTMQSGLVMRPCECRLRRGVMPRACVKTTASTLGLGINSGEVVVRAIGSALRMDYTAVGQTTHLAARMEQMAPPGATLLTQATVALAEHLLSQS